MISHWKSSSILVGIAFVVFVIGPFILPGAYPDFFTTTYKGIIQLSSVAYISASFAVYYFYSTKYDDPDSIFALSKEKMKELSDTIKGIAENPEQDQRVEELLSLSDDKPDTALKRVVLPIKEGLGPDAIGLICKHLIETSTKRAIYMSRYWGQVAATLPLLGMTGTIAGLLFMFSDGNAGSDKSSQLAGLGVALLTTLYASLFTVLWAKPLAKEQADEVDELLSYGKNLNNYGQRLAMQISPHDFENIEAMLSEKHGSGSK